MVLFSVRDLDVRCTLHRPIRLFAFWAHGDSVSLGAGGSFQSELRRISVGAGGSFPVGAEGSFPVGAGGSFRLAQEAQFLRFRSAVLDRLVVLFPWLNRARGQGGSLVRQPITDGRRAVVGLRGRRSLRVAAEC